MPPGASGGGGGGFPNFMMGQQKQKGEALKEYVRGILSRVETVGGEQPGRSLACYMLAA